MVLANLYLLCWDYDKLKFLLPFWQTKSEFEQLNHTKINNQFPIKFFVGVFITIVSTILIVTNFYDKKTRNTLQDCYNDCKKSDDTQPCYDFCDCIHIQGHSFGKCSEELRKEKEK
jgi:hypothetical protein